MSLVICPDCKKRISPRVSQCPFCGCPAEFFQQSDEAENRENVSNQSENIGDTKQGTEVAERSLPQSDEVLFGFAEEQNKNTGKFIFDMIQDPQRETDYHKNGKTHVIFRIGNEKFISVRKDDLFYGTFYTDNKMREYEAMGAFKDYLSQANSLSGITSGAVDMANKIMASMCSYYSELLVSYKIYEYDPKHFAEKCGGDILLQNTDAYEAILNQQEAVSDYADNLAYQRSIERSSRSQWQGGGFGLSGALKGAITAGALNATTGVFRGIGDSMTNASDRSDVNRKYAAIANQSNKNNLLEDFDVCLWRMRVIFLHIMGEKTGWNPKGVLLDSYKEWSAKLKNLENIRDKGEREEIFFELLSNGIFLNDVVEYVLLHWAEYDLNIDDLLHYLKRTNRFAYEKWLKTDFISSINETISSLTDEKKITAIMDYGTAFELITKDYEIVDTTIGPQLIRILLNAEMSNCGYKQSLEDYINGHSLDDVAQYFQKLSEIGYKYHILKNDPIKNEICLIDDVGKYDVFATFKVEVDEQLKKVLDVRGVMCTSLEDAVVLDKEWKVFDHIYTEYDTYADYDSLEMQKKIEDLNDQNFVSKHLHKLISGAGGLMERKEWLERREQGETYQKSREVADGMKDFAGDGLFVYGSDGFLKEAKKVREFDLIKKMETDVFPMVIFDATDDVGFKGFVVTDNYFYNYNSALGVGFGDKAIELAAVIETSSNGKKRIIRLANGKTEKIKMVGMEEQVIDVLSQVHHWQGTQDQSRQNSSQVVTDAMTKDATDMQEDVIEKQQCPNCGKMIAGNTKFCNFCGIKIAALQEAKEQEKVTCRNCGKRIDVTSKFCVFCGSKMINQEGENQEELQKDATESRVENIETVTEQ